jgi:hypothetical protein
MLRKEKVHCYPLFRDIEPPLRAVWLTLAIIEDVPEAFPTELLKTPPTKGFVDRHIDLESGTKPISWAPYRVSNF